MKFFYLFSQEKIHLLKCELSFPLVFCIGSNRKETPSWRPQINLQGTRILKNLNQSHINSFITHIFILIWSIQLCTSKLLHIASQMQFCLNRSLVYVTPIFFYQLSIAKRNNVLSLVILEIQHIPKVRLLQSI